ncbi:MAG: hypothetical protein NY202_00950 [Mollicutes bacterium UO1]
MKIAKQSEKEENPNVKQIFEIREKNHPLTALLKGKIGYQKLESYPQEIDYYLAKKEEVKSRLETEKKQVDKKINSVSGKELESKLQRKNDLATRIQELAKEQERSIFPKYLSYITNNERLWATMVYIFLSSFLISQIFPRDQIVLLRLHSFTEESLNKGLKLLKKFSPIYYTVYRKKGEKEEVIHVISCHLSK